MEALENIMARRSVRAYTGEPVPREQLDRILAAGLTGPTGKGKKPWRFVAVTDRSLISELADMRNPAPKAFETAGAAIAVFGDPAVSDTWVEDCSIAMQNMLLEAASLGLGSVWIQGRLREAANGQGAGAYASALLGAPEGLELEAVLLLGPITVRPAPHTMEDIDTTYVTWERF